MSKAFSPRLSSNCCREGTFSSYAACKSYTELWGHSLWGVCYVVSHLPSNPSFSCNSSLLLVYVAPVSWLVHQESLEGILSSVCRWWYLFGEDMVFHVSQEWTYSSRCLIRDFRRILRVPHLDPKATGREKSCEFCDSSGTSYLDIAQRDSTYLSSNRAWGSAQLQDTLFGKKWPLLLGFSVTMLLQRCHEWHYLLSRGLPG